ncbi:MAG TPA: iron-sulfur cluster assembly accessory protein [Planctomycetota bacterium]|nr:iron-sulfur cluster assembly accessory protein [Planctomycetota bacterium]
MAITVTEKAASKIREILKERNLPQTGGLRLGLKGGGCAGFEYIVDLANEPTKFDLVTELEGARVIVDKKSYLFLNGTEVDYQKTLMGQGFVFKNPNSKGNCGCGTSFNV